SASRYRSPVNAANSRTGSASRSAGTATQWEAAPTSRPAALAFTGGSAPGGDGRGGRGRPRFRAIGEPPSPGRVVARRGGATMALALLQTGSVASHQGYRRRAPRTGLGIG